MGDELGTVGDAFRVRLMASDQPRRLYMTEQVYRLQVDWACEWLDVAGDAVGHRAAMAIADAVWDRLAGHAASTASLRQMRAEAESFLLMTQQPDLDLGGLGHE